MQVAPEQIVEDITSLEKSIQKELNLVRLGWLPSGAYSAKLGVLVRRV